MSKPSCFSPENKFYPFVIVINVIITTFFAVMSAVATIIGDDAVRGELALSNTHSIWVTTLYLLGVNTTVPSATWFANHFGYKRMYTYGVLLFTLGTFSVAFATNFWILAVARFIEGIGAGFIFPVGLALIIQSLPKEKIALALNLYIGAAFGGGLGLGIPLAGYFTQFITWRAIFFLIGFFGVLAAGSCWLSRPENPTLEKRPFDFWGFLSFALFIASLLVALTLGPIKSTDLGWREPYIIGLFILAAVCLIATILIERRHPNPLIPLPVFKDPIFTLSAVAMFLLGMSLFASVSVSIDYMLHGLLYEKYVTGKIAAIYGVTIVVFGGIANRLIKFIPIPFFTFAGLALLIFSFFLNNELSFLTGPRQILTILFIRGAGVGLALGSTTLLALYGVPQELKNSAATLLTFFRQVGGTYGSTLIAIFTIRQTIFHTARFGEQVNTQIPGYRYTFRTLFTKFYTEVSDKGLESTSQAKGAIIKNIATQAYIQGQNDALIVFGYVTLVVAVVLAIFILARAWKERKKVVS